MAVSQHFPLTQLSSRYLCQRPQSPCITETRAHQWSPQHSSQWPRCGISPGVQWQSDLGMCSLHTMENFLPWRRAWYVIRRKMDATERVRPRKSISLRKTFSHMLFLNFYSHKKLSIYGLGRSEVELSSKQKGMGDGRKGRVGRMRQERNILYLEYILLRKTWKLNKIETKKWFSQWELLRSMMIWGLNKGTVINNRQNPNNCPVLFYKTVTKWEPATIAKWQI